MAEQIVFNNDTLNLIGVVGATTLSGSVVVDYGTNTVTSSNLSVNLSALGTGLGIQNYTSATISFNSATNVYTLVANNGVTSVTITYSGQTPNQFMAASVTATVLGVTTQLASGTNGTVMSSVVCFASGTRIRTVNGDIAVENLRVGDIAVTASGEYRPIRWLGHRTIDCRNHPRRWEVLPVRIAAHAFGENRPERDVLVSPGHSICVDVLGEILIPACALIDGSTVRQIEVDEVTYWHVELDSHDIVLADNLPAESYIEMNNRDFFSGGDTVSGDNVVAIDALLDGDTVHRTHADFCRPFHSSGPLVEAVRAQLQRRAAELGWRLVDVSDFYLEVDGKRVDPVMRKLAVRFQVPAGASSVWLVSTTSRPCDTIGSSDTRDLGLAVESLQIEDGLTFSRSVAIDDPLLRIGFYDVEEGRRWTTGRARLPKELWSGCEDDFYLRLILSCRLLPQWEPPAENRPRLSLVA